MAQDNKTLNDVIDRLKQEGALTRNSGTHSIKSVKETILQSNEESLIQKEDRKEALVRTEKQTDILANIEKVLTGAVASSTTGSSPNTSSKGGGALGMIAKGGLAGLGIGGGALAAGVGILAAGGGFLLKEVNDLDAEGIKKKVTTLLSIGDSFSTGNWGFLLEGGAFGLAMGGIGAGLAAFGIGQAVAGVSEAIVKFSGAEDFATNIKNRVVTLMSISNELGGAVSFIGGSATFLTAMTGIAAGLAVFGAGSAVAGVGAGLGDAITKFSSGTDFATVIKERVKTLMSIQDELGGASKFIGKSALFLPAMTGIAAGLAIFGAGSAVAGVGAGLADAITKFTSGDDFATVIKERVGTLLSISSMEGIGADTAMFLGSMTGIAGGLAIFGAGSAVAGVGAGLADAITKFTSGEDFATTIKNRVTTLLSITEGFDGDSDTSKAGKFALGMTKIAAGLTAFAAGQFVGTLANAGTAILDFFGVDNPFDQVMKIADKADDLSKGATALEKISKALNAFGDIKISNVELDFTSMAKNLAEAIPFLNGLATGEPYDPVGIGDYKFGKGLLDPGLRLDELAIATGKVNYILGNSEYPDVAVSASQSMLRAEAASTIANTVPPLNVAQPAPAQIVIAPSDNSTKAIQSSSSTTVVNSNWQYENENNPFAME